MSPTRPPKKLARLWAKKLANSGFEDIEQSDGRLKKWEAHYFNHRPDKPFQEAKTAYYRMAGYLLHDHIFEDEKEKLIWSLHAEGKGQRQIIRELHKQGHQACFDSLRPVINKLSAEMKRKYQEGKENE